MADTTRGDFPDIYCSDCKKRGTTFRHNGRLVPEGEIADLCFFCWQMRATNYANGKKAEPLGIKPPGEPKEFEKKAFTVKTQSGSIYKFGIPNETGERTISHNVKNLKFDNCEILLLKTGEDMWLRQEDKFWQTTRVVSITPIE
ncbi:hypothetical protein M0Q50_08690 [bacterium]|jgi:hypothetical protein|nr:hypothetical protein [bacterium]